MVDGSCPIRAADNRSVQLDGEKVTTARRALGLSRSALALKSKGPCSLTEVTIKRAEKGNKVYLDTARQLAYLLNLPLGELIVSGSNGGEPPVLGRHARVAVVPFRVIEGDASTDPFADGLAEDLITRISRWWFPVISRTSTVGLVQVDPDPPTKGPSEPSEEPIDGIGAHYLVEGSVRRAGNAVRVTAHLLDRETGTIVWRNAYERKFSDIFEVQRDLTTAIVTELSPRMLDAEIRRFGNRDPEDLDAWQQGLLGAWHFYRRTARDNARARALLEQAVKGDKHMPNAWYALALTHQQDIVNQWTSEPRVSMAHMGQVCTEFDRLYPTEAWSHVVSAYLDVYKGQREAAMTRLTEAIRLDPNACLAYALYGQTLAMARDPDRGIEQFEMALRLSPRDTERWSIYTGIALAHFAAERYEDTISAAAEASRIRPTIAFPYGAAASAHAHLGNLAEAREALSVMFAVEPNTTLHGLTAIMGSTEKDIAARYVEGLRTAGLSN